MDIDQSYRPDAVKSVEGWILVVVNLHEETTEADLQDTFSEFGPIRNLHLNLDKRTGYVKGYAFIEYAEKAQADRAIAEVNDSTILGQVVQVDYVFVAPRSVQPENEKTTTEVVANNHDSSSRYEERERSNSPTSRRETS